MADRWQIVMCGSCTAMEICSEPLWLLPVRRVHVFRIQRQGVEIYKRSECAADMWPWTCFFMDLESFGTFWNPFSCSLRRSPGYSPCLLLGTLWGGPVFPWSVDHGGPLKTSLVTSQGSTGNLTSMPPPKMMHSFHTWPKIWTLGAALVPAQHGFFEQLRRLYGCTSKKSDWLQFIHWFI